MMKTSTRPGFTLIELLVVIAIIGILIAVLIPAVQMAREAGRQMTCKNHLKQIGLAVQLHEEAHGYFPSGGWGRDWTGDPDMGFGARQPGGWIYDLLPYLELEQTHQMGAGLPWDSNQRKEILGQRCTQVVGLFHCPTRRPAMRYRAEDFFRIPPDICPPKNLRRQSTTALTDYAVNCGNCGMHGSCGPDLSCLATYPNCRWGNWDRFHHVHDGISFNHSEVGLKDITDGTHCTYFGGEKYMNPDRYDSGWLSLYHGDSTITCRQCGSPGPPYGTSNPRQDTPGLNNFRVFGSAHSSGFNMLMCDGSVHQIGYAIDGEVHSRLGSRNDGQVISKLPW